MPPKLDPESERVEACHKVALELVSKHGSVNAAAVALGLSQQTLNALVKERKLGIQFADQLAALKETTVDGLVWLYIKGGAGAVRAGNIQGWQRAAAEAESTWPEFGSYYQAAAETLLPVAPRQATPELVRDLARLLFDHTRKSHVRLTVQASAK